MTILLINWKRRNRKNRTYAEAVSGTKNIRDESVKNVQKIEKSALSTKDRNVVGNESIDLGSIYARIAQAISFSEDPPSLSNYCTDTSVSQNSSSSVNISESTKMITRF